MAHTTNATDTRNTLRDTEPEGERQRQKRERETHREEGISAFNVTLALLRFKV